MAKSFKDAIAGSKKPAKKSGKKDEMIFDLDALAADGDEFAEIAKEALPKMVDAKAKKKAAEADEKYEKSQVEEFCIAQYDRLAKEGQHHKSFKVRTGELIATYVQPDSWSIPQDEELLVKELGEGYFEKFIDRKQVVKLRAEVFQDEALQKKLMKLIGNAFDEFFEVEETLTAKPGLDKLVYEHHDPQAVMEVLKRKAASVR